MPGVDEENQSHDQMLRELKSTEVQESPVDEFSHLALFSVFRGWNIIVPRGICLLLICDIKRIEVQIEP